MANLLKWVLRAVTCALIATSVVQAQQYPTQPIKIVIGYAAGGTTDILARSVGEQLSKILNQTVIIENKAGAAGNLAAAYVSASKPDGYVLFMATVASHGINPALYKKALGYDPLTGFEPISMVASIPMLLVTSPTLPVKTVEDLIAYAAKHPGMLNYASSGNGAPNHLAGAMFADMAKIDPVHVPYRGGALANTSVMSGDTQYTFATMPAAMPQVAAGKLKALAVTTAARSNQLPDTPAMQETPVLKGFEINTWNALLAPKGTPPEVVATLNAAVVKAMQMPALVKRFEGEGATPVTSTPDELKAFIRSELTKWANVLARTPIKAD
ncbi:tripartite tricarboxylate transporter substrate binding protein [Orrella sp. NBD-18]|uniref:Tripartite tricarboxylate transporter substrate binding protein n=1 Tax=Sheuella amnicola TaxID=2707330 RepID=A0A6B2R311_9BURK|nr:tripartite tricarboxylate transporter substrate binding protein [Sheuella amnicola]NDY83437.1 tripartite tricarboxylate transporter substrate binding protein [Sheuella amnicola]